MFTSSNLVLGSSRVWLVSVTGPQLATTPLPQPQRQLQITAGSLGISVCYGFVFGFVPVYFCIFNLYFFTCPPLHISFVFFFCCIFWVAIVNLSLFMCFPSFASSASEQLHKTTGFSCLCFLGARIGSGLPKSYASETFALLWFLG